MKKEESEAYFKKNAQTYNSHYLQYYWRFSKDLLWDLMSQDVIQPMADINPSFSFLDAGGGTGVWSQKIIDVYESSKGCLCDISSDMLAVAQQSLGRYENIKIIKGDIERLEIEDNTYDLSFNFHNVLGFVESPIKALRELTRVTKPGGPVVSVTPNNYHCIFFNLKANRLDEAESAFQTDTGTFKDDMPGMNLFSPKALRDLYDQCGLEVKKVMGYPVTIYPDTQETDPFDSDGNLQNTDRIKSLLSNEEYYSRIMVMEKQLSRITEVASRGNELMIVGTKIIT